ncbi:DNA-binding protein [Massilia sp. LjRoot122]|uniref:DNA-binding protein n=1 Tax=Massilia sp. LjRoot122 TaxID=3342257 RepID=UPI003ECFD525
MKKAAMKDNAAMSNDENTNAGAAALQIPEAVAAALSGWVQQVAEQTAAPVREALAEVEADAAALRETGAELEAARDQALAASAEHAAEIERLNTELRDARKLATDALVSKAKDQLAIDGKDRQLADLRAQLERNVAAQATESDARLAAEMELVGATTARDNFEKEVKSLRAQLDKSYAERSALRTELESLRAKK